MQLFQLFTVISQLALAGATALPLTQPERSYTSSLVATQFGTVFDVPVTIGNQTFQLLVDTGSSDTYVMRTGYTCINSTNNLEIDQAQCLYSNHTYDVSSTYRQIPNENFGVQYGAGIASGLMAYEDVTLAGITVKGQEVGIADRSNPMGDGVNSGLLGLAYPSLTSAHPGNYTSNTTYWFNRDVYNPLIYNMHKQGLIDPYFSLALAHTGQNASIAFGGYLTLGGLPPVNHSSQFSVVPVEITKNIPLNFTSGKRVRSYWTTTVREVEYGPSASNLTINSTSFQAFIDSGNYFSFLPSAIVDPINNLFSPPAIYDTESATYIVDCSARAPNFGLKIGNQTFFHNGADLIYQTSKGVCVSSLTSSESVSADGISLNIIGVSFLKNVVAVFDFGRNQMRFAKRFDNNDNNSTTKSAGGK